MLRRLLSGLLVVALAQFGVVAAAPAHAHEGGSGHGVREIVLSHGHADIEMSNGEHGHDVDGHHDNDSHNDSVDVALGAEGAAPEPNDAGHGEHAHVHAFQQFAAADEATAPYAPSEYAEVMRRWETTADVRHSSFPPLRPPRASL
ncbi:MAG: hypothetical protein AB7G40_17220 [Hyphomonadaceae bacterium]